MIEPSVYVVILHNGWERSEYRVVVPRFLATKGVKVEIENPGLSKVCPVTDNRNRIKLRFIETGYGFLLMLDNDVVPKVNPVQLALLDKDVIGCPCKTMGDDGLMHWTAYMKNGQGYSPIDLDRIKDPPDLQIVDAVGTGCIIIKRQVLEVIKAPFSVPYDKDGIPKMGEDFEFCRRAQEAGFEIYTTPKMRCKHFKTVDVSRYTKV